MLILLKIIKNLLICLSFCFFVNAETLELEDTSLHGKKEQPEAMIFVSVSKTRKSYTEKPVDYLTKIIEEVKDNKFNIINIKENNR